MRVLVLDHGDASTPTLVKAIQELEAECEVRSVEETKYNDVLGLKPRRILLTPGPMFGLLALRPLLRTAPA